MNLSQYITSLNNRYKSGNATEHTFRGDLQQLIEALVPGIKAINEPKRQACGAPDYILTKKEIPIGYIEAKDLGADLNNKIYKEQFNRYKGSLDNLIFTDYLSFHLYRDGQFITKVDIGVITDKGIKPITENFERFEQLIKDFCTYVGQTIKSSKKLAQMMAGKARLLSEVIEKALTSDEDNSQDSTLKDQMIAFKQILIHDITPKGFADVYAQTIAYGMFAARSHDPSLASFSRQEAYELIPKSNPFLKKLFGYIAGLDVDDRIQWIVDDLVNIFIACNVEEMLKDYGKNTRMEDPIIHFYEDFLSEYDPKLRKARGVWYTPQPVVDFIVRTVDDILKTEFNLPQGLADTSKIKIKVDSQGKKIEQEVHKVQILDPAAGTGTFLAEVIKHVHKKFEGQQGIWSNYVENHLLPRLNGFELLMASYAMAHLKLDLLLKDTGYNPTRDQRFRVFLTNSLEEYHPDTGTLWANWLSSEANEANRIKKDTPVMVIVGNPPYSVSSTNKGNWIENLVSDYKKDLNERNIQPLSDDYIKFIRLGQYFIEKNGSGILAYISNNSFIDGIIHRNMRKHLLKTFDKIYILDLHGNSKKKEVSPEGSTDQNVFDIMQGVSINLFIKSGKTSNQGISQLFNSNVYGLRDLKYDFLLKNKLKSIKWDKLDPQEPEFYFVIKDFSEKSEYNKGFKINELFNLYANGIKTQRDDASIKFTKKECNEIKENFINLTNNELKEKYGFKDVRDWTINNARNDLISNKIIADKISYRPFDIRFMNYTGKTKGVMGYPRFDIMNHVLPGRENIGFILVSQPQAANLLFFDCVFVVDKISDTNFYRRGGPSFFPLYLYTKDNNQQGNIHSNQRIPNLNQDIVRIIEIKLGIRFTNEKEPDGIKFAPNDILDYIYAVLHSPTYREKYKEFLKIDFPRIPYPQNQEIFWDLVKLGGELRQIHLMESPVLDSLITKYPVDGDNKVDKIRFELYDNSNSIPNENGEFEHPDYLGSVFINDQQYFADVSTSAWEFYIGGYQPAQKWLKDRKGRNLDFDEILHYQKIIVALTETDRIMKEIDKIQID